VNPVKEGAIFVYLKNIFSAIIKMILSFYIKKYSMKKLLFFFIKR